MFLKLFKSKFFCSKLFKIAQNQNLFKTVQKLFKIAQNGSP
jgi:hypothetical protein